MKRIIDKYPILVLILIGVGLFAFNLVDLKVSIMEARNFIVAREMLTDGHWFLTTMNDIARYEKPPFPAWFTAPFAYVFGLNNVWAYRIPTSIFSILGLVYFFKLIRIWLPKDLAFYAALILGTSFYFIAIRFEAPSDMYTHINMIIGLYFLLKNHPNIHLKNILLGGLFFGLSVLSKGPVSPYTLFLPFILAYFFSFKINFKSHVIKVLGFLMIGLIIGGSWYVYVRFADPEIFLSVASDEAGNWTSYNTRPFYYYWSFFIQSGIWTIPAALGLAYPYFKTRIKHRRFYKFSFLWTILALVLLSIIPEKKPRYLLPVLFPLAFNTVLVINYLLNNKSDKVSKFFHYLHYSVIILVCVGVIVAPFFFNISWEEIWFVYLLISACALVIAYFTFRFLSQQSFKSLFWSNVLVILMITCIGQSKTYIFQKNKNYRYLSSKGIENQDIYTYHYKDLPPEVIWEFGKKTLKWSNDKTLQLPYRLLISKNNLNSFRTEYPQIFEESKVEVFDRNYYRTGPRKHERFITYVFEIGN